MPRHYAGIIYELDDDEVTREGDELVARGLAVYDPNLKYGVRIIKPYIDDWQKKFLAAYTYDGTIWRGCQAARVGRGKVQRELERNPLFKKLFDIAHENFVDTLEDLALGRAKAGSDRIIQFLLTSHRPGTFNQTHKVEAKVDATADVTSRGEVTYDHDQLSDILKILQDSGVITDGGTVGEDPEDSQT